jgi:hypothetical protein
MTHPSNALTIPVPPVNSARKDYAIAIFNWCQAHPASPIEEFLAMIERAEARVAEERGTWQ